MYVQGKRHRICRPQSFDTDPAFEEPARNQLFETSGALFSVSNVSYQSRSLEIKVDNVHKQNQKRKFYEPLDVYVQKASQPVTQ